MTILTYPRILQNIFSIFVIILDAIDDGALKEKANLILNFLISRDCEYP